MEAGAWILLLFERSMRFRFFNILVHELLKISSHVFHHLKDVNIEILYYNKIIGTFFSLFAS